MEALKVESKALDSKFEAAFAEELRSLKEAVLESTKSSDEASATAE